MATLPELRTRLKSLGELFDVVGAIRSLAAVRMQQASDALAGAREYADAVGGALAAAMVIVSEGRAPARAGGETGRRGVLVFCSEHGFVGSFNEILLGHVRDTLTPDDRLFIVGTRGVGVSEEMALDVAWALPMTSYREGVPVTARKIARELYRRFDSGELTGLETVHARSEAGGRWSIERLSLLPLNLDRFETDTNAVPPLHNLDGERLLEMLIEEYFFAELAHITMESLTAANAARLAAMSAAHDNIERKLDELTKTEHQLQQEAVTTELLDVVVGSEALLKEDTSAR